MRLPTVRSASLTLPENLYAGADRIFFIQLSLDDASGHPVSNNFYWVPGTLTTFDWPKTDLHAYAGAAPRRSHRARQSPRGNRFCAR